MRWNPFTLKSNFLFFESFTYKSLEYLSKYINNIQSKIHWQGMFDSELWDNSLKDVFA